MRAIAAGLTDVGRERTHNEDRFILLPQFHVYVVADGMGGHQSGEVASRMAASTIAGYFRETSNLNGEAMMLLLRDAVADANSKIFARADDSRAHRGMGTTVVAAAYSERDRSIHIAHAGDSRAYLLRDGKLRQLTRDHSLLADALLERPELTEADLSYLPKNVITRALGISPSVDVDVTSVGVDVGDVFLLCSDGLHGLVEEEEIAAIITGHESLTIACEKLVDKANHNGGRDNITAVLIRMEEDDEPWSRRTPMVPRGPSAAPEPPLPAEDPLDEVGDTTDVGDPEPRSEG